MVAARVRSFNWIWKYLLAIALGFGAAVRFYGHHHPTPLMCVLAKLKRRSREC